VTHEALEAWCVVVSARAPAESTTAHRHSAATVTLLAVSFYLIATTLPVTICYVLYLGFPEGDPTLTAVEQQTDPTWSRNFIYGSVRAVAEELGMSHYACNFYIYLCTSSVCHTTRVTSTSICVQATCSDVNWHALWPHDARQTSPSTVTQSESTSCHASVYIAALDFTVKPLQSSTQWRM